MVYTQPAPTTAKVAGGAAGPPRTRSAAESHAGRRSDASAASLDALHRSSGSVWVGVGVGLVGLCG